MFEQLHCDEQEGGDEASSEGDPQKNQEKTVEAVLDFKQQGFRPSELIFQSISHSFYFIFI